VQISNRRDLVLSANDTLFTSGTLGPLTPPCSRTCRGSRTASRHPPLTRLQPTERHEPSDQLEVFLLLSVVKVAVVLVITLTCVAYTVLLERKVIGHMQNRWDPAGSGRSACCSR